MSNIDSQIAQKTKTKLWFKMPLIIVVSVLVLLSIVFILVSKAYRFNVGPEQALPASFVTKTGVGFFIGGKYYTMASGTQVEISAPKYKSQTINLGDSVAPNVDVTLVPMPAKVTLNVAPAIENVTWSINSEVKHQGSQLMVELVPNSYQITAQSPYHEVATVTLDAQIGDVIEQTLALTQIDGSVTINSTPSGAKVKINGKDIGNTPQVINTLGGEHQIELSYDGYQVFKDSLEVTYRNATIERNYTLMPLQSQVAVTLKPSGGTLLLNGKPVTSPFTIDANKDHTLAYSKEGYIGKSQSIRLRPGARFATSFELSPLMGDVAFSSNIPASVTVNGKSLGKTPLRARYQAIDQKVTFSSPGFRAITKSFKPHPDRVTNVDVTMLTEFEARRAEGMPLFATQLGIAFVTVEGEDFIMGSNPNVPKRQRHEHQINVTFTKPFLLSTKEISEAQFSRFKQGTATTNLPVTNITWAEAAAFCNWLSQQEGLSPFYNLALGTVNKDSLGYRLPTEAEWEYTASKYRQYATFKYFWGNRDRVRDKQGNFADESLSGQQTFILKGYQDDYPGKAPVGSFAARSGLHDMDGNVSEWVHDTFNVSPPNLSLTFRDYLGPDVGSGHVVKGGSFKTGRLQNLRNAYRQQMTGAQDDVGFRIARYMGN